MIDRNAFDWTQFDAYRRMYVEDRECYNRFADGNAVLTMWEEAKNKYLHKLFPDGQLILEKRFSYERGSDEMRQEFSDMLDDFRSFHEQFRDRLGAILDPENRMYRFYHGDASDNEYTMNLQALEMMYRWFSFDALWENTIEFPYQWQMRHVTRYPLNIQGHELLLQPGMKLMKTWGKICGWLGLGEDFEKFRIRQSQLTNTKKVNGTMCLSIHPLDYATASDNENGWSSCMSWREHGCYRLGTVEMMNSPMVISTYIKSDKVQMEIADQPWNSKKWRAWVIITPECILMNRQYPYHNDSIGEAICQWVRELVEEKIGWHYEDKFSTDLMETIGDYHYEHKIPERIHFETKYMYNDVGGDDLGYVGLPENWDNSSFKFREYICFSGDAQCMWCGDFIAYNDNNEDADSLGCNHEDQTFVCEDCGHEMESEDEVWYGPNGEIWCSDCYNDHCHECEECGANDYIDRMTTIAMPYSTKIDKEYFEKYKDTEDRHHPIYEALVGHRYWGEPNIFQRRHPADTVCLCSNCMRRLERKWGNKIKLIQVYNEGEENPEYDDMSFDAEQRPHTYIIDPRETEFDDAMNYFTPTLYHRVMNDYASRRDPSNYKNEVLAYLEKQYYHMGTVLEHADHNRDGSYTIK